VRILFFQWTPPETELPSSKVLLLCRPTSDLESVYRWGPSPFWYPGRLFGFEYTHPLPFFGPFWSFAPPGPLLPLAAGGPFWYPGPFQLKLLGFPALLLKDPKAPSAQFFSPLTCITKPFSKLQVWGFFVYGRGEFCAVPPLYALGIALHPGVISFPPSVAASFTFYFRRRFEKLCCVSSRI